MIKTVIFDFDGVIAESVDIKTEAFGELFKGYPGHLSEIMDHHINNGGISRYEKIRHYYKNIIKQELSEEKFKKLCYDFHRLVIDKVVAASMVPGAEELLQRLLGRYQMYIASGTPTDEIREIVQRKNLEKYFKCVFGSPQKKGEIIKKILNDDALSADEAVFIGDSANDLVGAKEAGVFFIARIIDDTFSWLGDPTISGKFYDLNGIFQFIEKFNQTNK